MAVQVAPGGVCVTPFTLVQHALTLLAAWMHERTEKEIAELAGISEQAVTRDLEWALDLIKQRESGWRGERTPQKTNRVADQMPATVCAECEGAITCGEDRVIAVAASRSRNEQGDVVEMTRALTFCDDCAMKMPEFTIVNDIKVRVERRADDLAQPSAPGMDALDSWRRADAEPTELSDGWEKPERFPRSTDSVRRETLSKFLADRRSWGKMRTMMRQVATLFVEGRTQKEIAQRVGIDQGTASRMIREALRIAGATA